MFAILHTWGQNLSLHPHLHCVVPSGGFTPEGSWKDARNHGAFLFPVKAMSTVFRAKYMACIRDRLERFQINALHRSLRDNLFCKAWVVYAKRPFGGPEQVIEYLGRYTHKIAISNHRLKGIDEKHVIFSYKDYKQSGKNKMMTLDKMEFVRRFSLHILPKRFVRIRHYGVLSSTAKRGKFERVKQSLKARVRSRKKKRITERRIYNPNVCSVCKKESMIRVLDFDHRGPPALILQSLSKQSNKVNENNDFKKTA